MNLLCLCFHQWERRDGWFMNSLAMNVMLCVHGQATTQYFHTFHHVFQTCCVAVSAVSLCGSLSHLKADLLNESRWGNYLESELDEETDFQVVCV